ncbi:PDDEXK nuclease domain-containing protein [Allomeiothermus silvanus]|uniref:PDDEXK nuclease domain-containing protein n=1 Tax=Allomeiothermus silvanus TaxID=52022 RepID=UPI0023EFA71D|nr:PDDEXK nuclease domain-containing protein [Allomeiothermus silvanus]
MSELLPQDYPAFLQSLKERIRQAQVRAALSVNRELVLLYWQIGREILNRQEQEGWGAKVIDRLAQDLRQAFPQMKGFSPRNLKYMRAFAQAYPEEAFVQQAAAQIPWFHNCLILDRLKDPAEREWYIRACIQHGWSRAILEAQIETGLYRRQGAALTNFARTLPAPQSELAQQVLKDPYNFDFLSLHDEAVERDLERALLEHLQRFMLELGVGFAFVGSQYPLEVDGQDYYLDLLFYHLKLRCYVVVELKMTEFKPEYAGKMNFYLSAVDDLLRHPTDGPTLGLILCKSKRRLTVEYALRDLSKPLGVSSFQLAEALPKELEAALPSVEQLEAELSSDDEQPEAR